MNFFEVCNGLFIFAARYYRKVAGVVELVDTLDLGSSAARCESSSLSACTKTLVNHLIFKGFFVDAIKFVRNKE